MRVHSNVPPEPGQRRQPSRNERPALVEVGNETEPSLHRDRVYDRPVVDGRIVSQSTLARLRRWIGQTLTSRGERAEADLERKLRELPRATRPNVWAQMSPKGGVGKTSMTFIVGSLFARLGHRVCAIDLNPDSGTLGGLVPERDRSPGQLEELLEQLDTIQSSAELGRYISRLSSGLHLLPGSRDLDFMASIGPQRYGEFLNFLSPYYDLLLLDLGTGIADGIPRFALEVADQVLVVTTPDWQTIEKTHDALHYLEKTLEDRPLTVALNLVDGTKRNAITSNIERTLGQAIGTTVTVPRDERLRLMLDSGTYNLDALSRPTRMALRELGLTLGESIV